MGQNWRLGDFGETGPFMPERDEAPTQAKPRKELHRLMIEAAHRTIGGKAKDPDSPSISRVEAAMQRNAPELAGAPAAELALLEAEREALMNRRWPRPRLLSLILVGTLAALVPTVMMRLLFWSLVLFIVSAVAVGPERVRDALNHFGLWFLGYWRHELHLAQMIISPRD
ncbi:MAG: hypothetical protein ACU0A6_15945 [Shimia sp.]|jgi:hypothetical protein|uniref:hypothetical protein n=1 Tax=Shimia sp. TaxID=1954381 RepID=UPI004059D2C4